MLGNLHYVSNVNKEIFYSPYIPAEFIHVCKGNDPQLPACLISSVESLQPLMAAGIPAMNVPSVEPLYIGNLLVAERATAQGIQIQAIDIRVYNATQFKIFNMQ